MTFSSVGASTSNK